MENKKRSVEDFHIEFSETAQKLGLLEFQYSVEIPEEIEKLRIKMHNLAREGKKLRDSGEMARYQAMQNGMKIDLPEVETPPEPPSEPTEPVAN